MNDVLTLKGLVFKSDLFVDGIEAIEYPYLDYTYKAGSTAATTQWEDEQAEKVLCKVLLIRKNGTIQVVPELNIIRLNILIIT